MINVHESDLKVFKQLHPIALDRFSRQALDETEALLKDNTKSSHDTYLAIYKLIERRDKEMANVFDDYLRSTAFWQIAKLHSRRAADHQRGIPAILAGDSQCGFSYFGIRPGSMNNTAVAAREIEAITPFSFYFPS